MLLQTITILHKITGSWYIQSEQTSWSYSEHVFVFDVIQLQQKTTLIFDHLVKILFSSLTRFSDSSIDRYGLFIVLAQ